jgi:hypothetical protein
MNIGFDLDKVFIDYPPFISPRLIDRLYKKRDNGVLIYKIPGYPEQIIRRISHLSFLRPPIKNNMDFLKTLSKKENHLYLISSRFKFLEKRTQKLIKKYALDKIFDEMFFNFGNIQPHVFKNDVIKKLKLDVYVDDDLSLLRHVAKNNSGTHFFWLNYNGREERITKNITSITKLEDMFKHSESNIKNL